MSNLVLDAILLYSARDRRARRVTFNPKRTIVLGSNDTGKSSLLKSIYYTFGADPAIIHDSWKAANVITLVRFHIGERKLSILRRGPAFTVFNEDEDPIETFDSIVRGLGPFLSRLLACNLILRQQNGSVVSPHPVYLFLPYYIDQDASWKENWSGFNNLSQIPKWRKDVVEYHVGIKPDEYYVLKVERDRLQEEVAKAILELDVLKHVQVELKVRLQQGSFNIDIESFREEISELLVECQKLNVAEDELRERLIDLHKVWSVTKGQLLAIETAIKEVRKDYAYATQTIVENEIECPTCGAVYSNDFSERFAIATDGDRLEELRLELNEDLATVNKQIALTHTNLARNQASMLKIDQILETKQSEILLRDVIVSEGRREVKNVIDVEIESSMSELHRKQYREKELQDGMNKLVSKDRRNKIIQFYKTRMDVFLADLDVKRIATKRYEDITGSIKETGSDLPRALLAYYFSILHTIQEFSSVTFCPIIIDSPNQQAQDDIRLEKVLTFIRDHQPEGSQMILAAEDLRDVVFEDEVITLDEPNYLLSEDQFHSVSSEILPLLDKSYAHQKEQFGRHLL